MTTVAEIELIMRNSIVDEQITSREHTRNMNSTTMWSSTAGVDIVAHAVEDEVFEVGEEVVVHEVIAASSRASVLPKNLIAPLPYRITRGGVPGPAVPSPGAHRKEGWRRLAWRCNDLERW